MKRCKSTIAPSANLLQEIPVTTVFTIKNSEFAMKVLLPTGQNSSCQEMGM